MDFEEVPYEDIQWGKELGAGSFGSVYQGTYLGTDIAIKEILPSTEYDVEKYFAREWRILQACRHPNVVLFIGLSKAPEPDGRVFIISEYVSNGNLRTYILSRDKPFPWRLRLSFAVDIARALAYLHARKCLHRDLKGENLLITANNRIKLTDFGFARIGPRNDEERSRITYCGTDGYMSPEILRGEAFDERTDVFSLGILLAEIASRRLVESGKVFGRYAPTFTLDPSEIRRLASPGCPTALLDLVLQCCQEVPVDRPYMPEILARLQTIEADILSRTSPGSEEHVGSIRIVKDGGKRPDRLQDLFAGGSSTSSGTDSTQALCHVDMDAGDDANSNDEEEVLREMTSGGGHARDGNVTTWRTATWGQLPSEILSRLARIPARQAQPATAIADAPRVLSQHVIMSSASEIKVEGEAAAPKASTMTVRPVDITSDDAPPAPQPAVPAPPALVPPESAVSAYEDSYIYLASPSIQTHRFSLAREAPRRAETTPKKRSSFQSAFQFLAPRAEENCAHCKKRVKTRTTLECDDCHVIVHMRCSQHIPSDCADRQRLASAQ